MKNALKGLNSGDKLSSSLFLELDDPEKEKQIEKIHICGLVQKPISSAAKEIMKDCPGKDAAEMFQLMIGQLKDPDKISDHSLAHVCHKVEMMKQVACRDSKVVFFSANSAEKPVADKKAVPIPNGASTGANAKTQ